MAVKRSITEVLNEEKRDLPIKEEYKDRDNSIVGTSVYMEKWRKHALTKYFKKRKGFGLATGIREIIFDYMSKEGIE